MNSWIFWAKWSRSGPPYTHHPLLCHLVDVAAVTQTMWREVLPPSERRRFSETLDVDESSAERWIAFWAGLHDIGKASPAFQLQLGLDVVRDRLTGAGLRCPASNPPGRNPHGTISARVLPELLHERFGVPAKLATRVATVIGGHHGVFPSSGDVQDLSPEGIGKGKWIDARTDLAERLATELNLPQDAVPGQIDNATAMALAGLVSVADWIGSNEEYFQHEARDTRNVPQPDIEEYTSRAREQALNALRQLGWLGWKPSGQHLSFSELFPFIEGGLRPVQSATVEIAEQITGPGLVVVEAPMGEGKTEAAMYLSENWSVSLGQRGSYFALPTMATSDQMFSRVKSFLSGRYPESMVNLQLLHGHAALSAEFQQLQHSPKGPFLPEGVDGEPGSDGAPANILAAQWFIGGKKALLAPFGVGTVDQALLAVLQTRHVFVRLFGLGAKTVIMDEVHAYDTYMTTLLSRLLEWLGALGASVVMLSATLPSARRNALLEAYARGAGWQLPEPPSGTGYPRLTWVTESSSGSVQVGTSSANTKRIEVEWVDDKLPVHEGEPFSLGKRLREALADGGCVAVVCNTVKRAQDVYKALKRYFPGDADDGLPVLDLLHARYLYKDREEREKRALDRFGKDLEKRPHHAVLVSTQIIEQSLDLDFDLMVTEHAPADLVLQRMGRMHRHERGPENPRPRRLAAPRLWVCKPDVREDGTPDFGPGTEAVYDQHVLLRSWLELRDRSEISIPDDIERIVEAIYDERASPAELSDALSEKWAETLARRNAAFEDEELAAKERYIKWPGYQGALAGITGEPREEDAPELHPAHQAMTRLIEISVSVVCLYGARENPSLDCEGKETVDLRSKPGIPQAQTLLRRSVTITDRRLAYRLLNDEPPTSWLKSPLLRNHRLLTFDQSNSAICGRFEIRIDDELGITTHDAQEDTYVVL